jgi:hypothetical protein
MKGYSAVRIVHVEDGKTDGLPDGVAEMLKTSDFVRRGFGTIYVTSAGWERIKRRVPETKQR